LAGPRRWLQAVHRRGLQAVQCVAGLRCGDRRAGHGYFTLRDQIFGSDPQPQPQPQPPPAIPYFEGVAEQRVGLGFSDALPPPQCMTWEILVEGRDNDESGIYVMHGTPRLNGYFLVDSGDLQMGITPVGLKPITSERRRPRS
jgi:hypothetical protein